MHLFDNATFDEQTAATFKISASNDWLLHQQGLALSALSPTTPEAWQSFFVKIHEGMNYKAFAQDWNQSANGKDCFYVITEVLSPIVKT